MFQTPALWTLVNPQLLGNAQIELCLKREWQTSFSISGNVLQIKFPTLIIPCVEWLSSWKKRKFTSSTRKDNGRCTNWSISLCIDPNIHKVRFGPKELTILDNWMRFLQLLEEKITFLGKLKVEWKTPRGNLNHLQKAKCNTRKWSSTILVGGNAIHIFLNCKRGSVFGPWRYRFWWRRKAKPPVCIIFRRTLQMQGWWK